jgi:serine/tyrosine/threonine adenylyltransferase
MRELFFDNRFTAELPGEHGAPTSPRQVHGACWSTATPTPVRAPSLLAHSAEVAALLGLGDDDVAAPAFAEVFAGNRLLPGMKPYAACYGGHQFGHWAGQLGDGRAISLGEVVTPTGQRQELQLKGAGPTPYSRRADGRAVLRSSIREFLCSEAMHHLGVPTTRALCLVKTGEEVMRDMLYDGHPRLEPGAVVCRVAPSFLRFGSYEIFAARGELALLERLVDFTVTHHFPHLEGRPEERRAAFFREVCERTGELLAHWLRVGFVHGVLNTDNMSILGLTLDYGPYGWVDNFDPAWTPNTTDAERRRYRFGAQPDVVLYNLSRLAEALLPLFASDAPLLAGLEAYGRSYAEASARMTAQKLGLKRIENDDVPLVEELYGLLRDAEIDMTLFFRSLADVDPGAPSSEPLRAAFYRDDLAAEQGPRLSAWLSALAARVRHEQAAPAGRRARMNAANPRFVLRNCLAQEAIDKAEAGDHSLVGLLLDVLRRPYDEQSPERARFAARRPDWARHKVGCSMLSCSS